MYILVVIVASSVEMVPKIDSLEAVVSPFTFGSKVTSMDSDSFTE